MTLEQTSVLTLTLSIAKQYFGIDSSIDLNTFSDVEEDALLGCLLGEDWTTARLIKMVVSPDGHVLGRCDSESSFKAFRGASEDLIKNIHGVAPVAELDGDEIGFLVAKVAEIKRQR